MRRLFVLPLLAAMLLASVAPVSAQQEFTRFASTNSGVFADAFWETCTPDTPEPGLQTCTNVGVQVFDGKARFREGTGQPTTADGYACLGISVVVLTDDFQFVELLSDEFGCLEDLGDAQLTIADDLSSVTLTATIPVQDFVCDETFCGPVGDPRLVEVDVMWTAVSEAVAFRERNVSHSVFDGQKCTFMFSGRGVRADALASGTVDGMQLGDSSFASISDGRNSFSQRCSS